MSDGFVKDDIPVDHGFVQVPHGLWTHPELSHLDKVLLGWLWSHDARFLARLSTREIRRQFNRSGAIPAALVRLQECGFIVKETTGRRTQYRLVGAPWAALFGVRHPVENEGDGPRSGPLERAAIRTSPEPRSGPQVSRDPDHREEQLEDHVRTTDDDSEPVDNSTVLPFKARSSSSDFDTAIKIAAKAIALKKSKGTGYEASTRKGMAQERGDDVRSFLAKGLSAQEVAYKLVGDRVYVRLAMRELGMEYQRPYDPDTGAYLAETVF